MGPSHETTSGRAAIRPANRTATGDSAVRSDADRLTRLCSAGAFHSPARDNTTIGPNRHAPAYFVAARAGYGRSGGHSAAWPFDHATIHIKRAAIAGPRRTAQVVQPFVGWQAEKVTQLATAGTRKPVAKPAFASATADTLATDASIEAATADSTTVEAAADSTIQAAAIKTASAKATAVETSTTKSARTNASAPESAAFHSATAKTSPTEPASTKSASTEPASTKSTSTKSTRPHSSAKASASEAAAVEATPSKSAAAMKTAAAKAASGNEIRADREGEQTNSE
jgi:hypothetical protein